VVHSVVDSLSITSEAIDNLGEYEENVTEKQKDTIYKIEHKLPLKPSHRDGKHQVQNSRGQQVKHKLSQWQKPYSP
jgi:hypothetical protein